MTVFTLEYVWVDGSGLQTRSKTRTVVVHASKMSLEAVPTWNYDGSSCGQAATSDSEVTLIPCAIYPDPFASNDCSFLVLCESRRASDDTPLERGSQRHIAVAAFGRPAVANAKCWYGFEQEYVLLDKANNNRPLGWPCNVQHFPAPQGAYYCASNAIGRQVAREHYEACLRAGLSVSGYNAEVMLGQWEYQIGPCEALEAGDQLTLARYLLDRVCERHNLHATLDPKPVAGDWNGSGLHTNFSTVAMRTTANDTVAWKALTDGIERLRPMHVAHMRLYGDGNERRLTGAHETSSAHLFTSGIGNRAASIRIGNDVARQRCGYFEDRRPAANGNPYLISAALALAICCEECLPRISLDAKKK